MWFYRPFGILVVAVLTELIAQTHVLDYLIDAYTRISNSFIALLPFFLRFFFEVDAYPLSDI